jgi:hypothetical protein
MLGVRASLLESCQLSAKCELSTAGTKPNLQQA